MSVRREGGRITRRQAPRRTSVALAGQALAGSGPALALSGSLLTPASIAVSVTAGALGVATVTFILNGATLLSGATSAASLPIPGVGGNLVLAMSAGPYAGDAYTLVVA